MEHLFSVEAMVHGYHKYFRAGVKFRMGPLSFACYHHQTSNPEVCLSMHALAEEIPEDCIFHSTLHLGQVEAVISGLNLAISPKISPSKILYRMLYCFQ